MEFGFTLLVNLVRDFVGYKLNICPFFFLQKQLLRYSLPVMTKKGCCAVHAKYWGWIATLLKAPFLTA